MRSRLAPFVFGTLFSLGLAGCQSYETGIEVVCQAPVRCEACMNAPPDRQSQLLARYLEGKLRNPDAKATFARLAEVPAEERVEIMREATEKAQLTTCPYVDYLEGQARDVEAAAAEPAHAPKSGPMI